MLRIARLGAGLIFAAFIGWLPAAASPNRSGARSIASILVKPPPAAVAAAPSAGRLLAVHIASRIGSRGPADTSAKHALARDGVTLYAVLEILVEDTVVVVSDAPTLRWRGAVLTPSPRASHPDVELTWHKIEPTATDLSNTASGTFRYQSIPYRASPFLRDSGELVADVHPTLTPDRGNGLGTMRYQVVARQGTITVASPGIERRRGGAAGGLADAVHRVSLRSDDSFLGYLTEMYGQPYVWASAGRSDSTHQSERLEGSDCADFMVYGARRTGRSIPYGWTGSLARHSLVVAAGTPDDDGIYRDRHGRPLAFPRRGDLLLFPRHVGALVDDRGHLGVLDAGDILFHTLFDSPKQEPIATTGYARRPVQVLRWRPGGLPDTRPRTPDRRADR